MPAPKASLELSESIHQNDPFHGVTWYDAKDFGIRGLAWPQHERERAFDRLPTALLKQCDEKMRPLSTYSTGLHIDFEGAAQELYVRWTMYPEYRRNQKMSELANSGLDAYGRDDDGNWRWLAQKRRGNTQLVKAAFTANNSMASNDSIASTCPYCSALKP